MVTVQGLLLFFLQNQDLITVENGNPRLRALDLAGSRDKKELQGRGGAAWRHRGRRTPTNFIKIKGKSLFSTVHVCGGPRRRMHRTPTPKISGFAPAVSLASISYLKVQIDVLPRPLQQLPVQWPGSHVECTRIAQQMSTCSQQN